MIEVSSRSNPALIPCPCFASNMLNNCSFLWFSCKHVDQMSVSMFWMTQMLCVATKMMKTFSFQCFVCTHNENFENCVAILMLKTCSFLCIMCTHVDDTLDMLPFVCLLDSSLVASRMLPNCSFQCLDCNNEHDFTNEKDIMVYSHFGVLVFPHLEDVQMEFAYIDLGLKTRHLSGAPLFQTISLKHERMEPSNCMS